MLIFSTMLPYVQAVEKVTLEPIVLPTCKVPDFNEKTACFNISTPPTTTTAERIFK